MSPPLRRRGTFRNFSGSYILPLKPGGANAPLHCLQSVASSAPCKQSRALLRFKSKCKFPLSLRRRGTFRNFRGSYILSLKPKGANAPLHLDITSKRTASINLPAVLCNNTVDESKLHSVCSANQPNLPKFRSFSALYQAHCQDYPNHRAFAGA